MRLVKFEVFNGKTTYVNPEHVRRLTYHGDDQTQIALGSDDGVLVKGPIDEVMKKLMGAA